MRWRWWSFLLLLPVAPLLGWGPFTHVYTTRLAWRKAKAEEGGAGQNELVDLLAGREETFWRASVSADTISAYHVLKDCSLYDYMHNWIPDRADGVPRFGYALVAQSLAGRGRLSTAAVANDLAVACGWLAHQLADWWAHYAPIAGTGTPLSNSGPAFAGYANSFRVIGTDYYPEVLEHYRVMDHALTELLYDLLVLFQPDGSDLRDYLPALFLPRPDNPLTVASELWAGRLPRVPADLVRGMQVDFTRVMRGTLALYGLLRPFRWLLQERVDHLLDFSASGHNYLDLCAEKIRAGLFGVTLEQIEAWGTPDAPAPEEGLPFAVREIPSPRPGYPGNPLFEVASLLGSVQEDLDSSSIPPLLDMLAERNPTPSTLMLQFLGTLALVRFDDPPIRLWFRRFMPPVITLAGCLPHQVETQLPEALRRGELEVVFVPAADLGDNPASGPKSLRPETARLMFNGYDVDKYPAYFTVEKTSGEGKITWHCRLRHEVPEGYHYVWATVKDRSGRSSLPFAYQVQINGPTRPR